MKTAVIMSGHFRTLKQCLDSFKDMLPDDTEYYAYLLNKTNQIEKAKNKDNESDFESALSVIQKETKLQYSIIEDEDIDMDQYKILTQRFVHFHIEGKTKKQITEKWLKQLNDYKKSFEWMDSFGKKYNMVYRIRPDLVINQTKFSSFDFDPKYFTCFNQNMYSDQINDKFFCGNYDYIKSFMTGILESLKDENINDVTDVNFNVEQYLYRYLRHMKFDINVISRNDLLIRKIMSGKELCAGLEKN